MVCGIDLGSRYVKMVIMRDSNIVDTKIMDTIRFYKDFGRSDNGTLTVNFAAIGLDIPPTVVATGYGRNTVDISGAVVLAELKAHTIGAVWQTGLKDFTLLDLGGQDSKVIKVRSGKMADFDTNDKCAASTGRYLENMANVLGIQLSELSEYYRNPVELNATCAIFGESELINKIVAGFTTPELAAGVNLSIFKRIKPMLIALKSNTIVFTGGVALGNAIKILVEQEIGVEVVVPRHPQLNGAIGCAVYGGENYAVRD